MYALRPDQYASAARYARSCEAAVERGSNGPEDSVFAQCKDFVGTGGISGEDGSCCKVDNAVFDGWCLKVRVQRAQGSSHTHNVTILQSAYVSLVSVLSQSDSMEASFPS